MRLFDDGLQFASVIALIVSFGLGLSATIQFLNRMWRADGGRSLSQTIVCASDSYKFDIRGQVMASGSEVSGDWRESTRGVNGAITGRIADDHFNGVVNGEGFTAGFSLRVSGRRLAFALRPTNSDIVRVDVSLSR